MIRQDEASRRAAGPIYLDNRESMLGPERGEAFERAVSYAASIGALFTRNGFALRLGMDETPITAVDEETFLDLLAGVRPGRGRSLGRVMTGLRLAGAQDTSLVFIGAPPPPQDLPRPGAGGWSFGSTPCRPGAPERPGTRSRKPEGPSSRSRATQAHLTLVRAGWDCLVLSPTMRLRERWHTPEGTTPRLQRLSALVAIALVAIAVGFAFGRILVGHGATYRMIVVGLVRVCSPGRRSAEGCSPATLVSAVSLAARRHLARRSPTPRGTRCRALTIGPVARDARDVGGPSRPASTCSPAPASARLW